MKRTKIINYFLKRIRSGKTVWFQEVDDLYAISDSLIVFLFEKSEFELNIDLFKSTSVFADIIDGVESKSVEFDNTWLVRVNNELFAKYENNESFSFLSEKTLSYFDFPKVYGINGCGSNSLKPMVIKENCKTVGLIVPFKINI